MCCPTLPLIDLKVAHPAHKANYFAYFDQPLTPFADLSIFPISTFRRSVSQNWHRIRLLVGTDFWYCQVNDIQTEKPIVSPIPLLSGHDLGARYHLPVTKCPRAKLAIVNRSRQVPTQPEQIAYHAIDRKKALRLPC